MGSEDDRRSWVEQIMGLPISVLARGPAARSPEADKAVAAAFAELRDVDAMFSPYRPDSAVSRAARGELAAVDSPPLLAEVEQRCARAYELTGGLFDARKPDGGFDPSGLVKGWAAERAFAHLAAVPGADWCFNAGGDVLVGCPSGRPFTVGIQDPADPRRVVAALPLSSGGVATSGTAARGAHLYDPRTGGAATQRWASVSVTGPSLELADVLATAAFVAGPGWADVLAVAPGHTGLAVAPGGALHPTPGWPGRPA